MNRKYFFFDIDGTLTVKKTGEIVPSALKTLKELQDKGHFVALATGRAHYKSTIYLEKFGLHNMVCSGGGGLVINDKLICNKPLDKTKAKIVLKECIDLGYGILLELDDSNKVYSKSKQFVC